MREEDAQQAMMAHWNEAYLPGIHVVVVEDDGKVTPTRTRSRAWMVGGVAVVKLAGRTGGFRLDRVAPYGSKLGAMSLAVLAGAVPHGWPGGD